MKKLLLLTPLLLSAYFSTSQSITGNWEGVLNVQGTELPIIFHIKKDSANLFSATFDSPNQKAFNLPCSGLEQKQDSLVIYIKMINGKYEGLMSSDRKTVAGKWFQGTISLPLDLKKTSDIVVTKEIKRPQTPKPPFFYNSEEVTYSNADKSVQFGGTLTYPKEKVVKKYPGVLLITGSGQQDRDETIFDHKSFAVIADYLTKNGIAVLRVDDRGKGKTTGNFGTATTADFAADAEAGISYLKTLKTIDTNNIGIIGHSEGGMIAPMVAAKRKDIKFIVLLAGPGVPIKELMEKQSADVMTAANVLPEDVALYRPLYRNLTTAVLSEKDTAAAFKKGLDIFNYWQQKTASATILNTVGVTDEKSKAAFIRGFVNQLSSPWFSYFIKFNPADYLSKVSCPVLAINGEKDIQVSAKENLGAIQKAIPKATIKEMPGLNHLFQHCKTCSVDEYADLEETFAPEVLQLMGEWIKEKVK